jgi:hypothetical protein
VTDPANDAIERLRRWLHDSSEFGGTDFEEHDDLRTVLDALDKAREMLDLAYLEARDG